MTTLLASHGLSVTLSGRPVLHDINFAISAGEIVTVVGPNGAGKSTFIKALIGSIPVTAGTIERKPDLRTGYVPQKLEPNGTMPMTVERFLSLPVRRSRRDTEAALERTGVAQTRKIALDALSGGQFQRVMLARSILGAPELLVLDEPTQGLDQPGTAAFYLLIEELRRELGCGVLMVSHDLHVVMGASDRVICLNGHICCEGAPQIVSAAPEYRALFGLGTRGAFGLYQHAHDHVHDEMCDHEH